MHLYPTPYRPGVTRRVLVLARNVLPHMAGVRRATWDLASGLRMRRWEVTLMTTGAPGHAQEFDRDGLHVVAVPGLRPRATARRWKAAAAQLVRDLGLETYDAVIGAGPSGDAMPACRSPFVFQCHEASLGRRRTPAPLGAWNRPPRRSLKTVKGAVRQAAAELGDLRRADAVIVPRPSVQADLARWPYRVLPAARRARVVRNGVDTRRFHPHVKAAAAWRRAKGIPEDAALVVTACPLVGAAGVQDALAAFRSFQRSVPDARYVIVGAGPAAANLRRRAAALRLGSSVAFAGEARVAMVARWLQAADLCLHLPRGADVQPTATLLEALACGPDVVATSMASDLGRPHDRLHVVRPCDPAGAARAMAWAWHRRQERRPSPFPLDWTLGRSVQAYEAVLTEAMAATTGPTGPTATIPPVAGWLEGLAGLAGRRA